jgi:omega-amidase
MRLTIVQSELAWENAAANRSMFARKIAPLAGNTDLVVLPEMFTTGFSMNAAALAEPMDGPTVQWMGEQAAKTGAAVTGSFICMENRQYFNRLIFMRPDGTYDLYDKRHLFTLAGEHEFYTPGNKQIVADWMGWRIRPLVCYDLRFPVWSRNAAPHDSDSMPSGTTDAGALGQAQTGSADLYLYVANWPGRRAHHWRTLLAARAIENQAFVAGVNIVGKDGNGHEYVGDSAIIDFSGQPFVQISGQEGAHTTELSLDSLRQYRQQLPFLQDADVFQLP